MITPTQAQENRTFHKNGCTVSVSSNGEINTHVKSYRRTTQTVERWKRQNKWRCSIKRGDGKYVEKLTQDNCHEFHLPKDCPLNPAEYTINNLQLILCKGHADIKEKDLGLEVTRGNNSTEKCMECKLLQKENDDMEVLAQRTLLESLDTSEKSSVRIGYWKAIGNNPSLYEFTPWEKSASAWQDGVLSFAQYGEQRIRPHNLITLDSDDKDSKYLSLIETAVNNYLKENPVC